MAWHLIALLGFLLLVGFFVWSWHDENVQEEKRLESDAWWDGFYSGWDTRDLQD